MIITSSSWSSFLMKFKKKFKTQNKTDNEIHLFMMSTTNLLILFCVWIEVRRVKRSQFNAIQTMLECCVSEKVDHAEFSSTRQHSF